MENRTRDLLTTLLENVASRAEIEEYLHDFAEVDAAAFAVIKVGGGVLRDELEELASALALLHRLGLVPVLVHGAGPQIDAALAGANIETGSVNGLRITTPEVLQVVRRVLQEVNASLAHALERRGARARPIISGVFEAQPHADAQLGLVGDVQRVNLEPVNAALRAGCLPVVACLGESPDGRILNINGDVAAAELAVALQPGKIVFLTPTGGLLDERQRIIPAINLVEDGPHLLAQPWVSGGMALKLRQIQDLLERMPARASVSITSPGHLARELFTYQGCGTLVRRGEPIHEFNSLAEIDLARMTATLESSFNRTLDPSYFDALELDRALIAREYIAAAIITEECGLSYLDKFAVTARAQGLGLGASLWNRIRASTPQLFWRSRRDNPINTWYFKQADGMQRRGDWVIFWYGLDDRALIEQCINHAASLPSSWIDFATPKEEVAYAGAV